MSATEAAALEATLVAGGDRVPGAADMAAAVAYIRDGRKGSVSVRIMRR